jgi:hypothetical protein
MDPLTLTALTVASGAASAATQFATANASADAETQRADVEAAWSKRRAMDERAGAQRGAAEETRKATLAQSRLTALAGASGSGTDDKTVMDLHGGIEREGLLNSTAAMAAGEQRATGMEYQADLSKWAAASSSKIKRNGARTSLIGDVLRTAGSGAQTYYSSRMAQRYDDGSGNGGYGRTGYGRR